MRKAPLIYLTVAFLLSGTTKGEEIYVSPSGNDANPGTIESPYQTLQKAAQVAQAGDICYVREGVYEELLRPENSGTEGNPIIFKAYQGENVIITAMQALNGWTLDAGSVYKTTVDWDLGQKNFVMHESTACDLARWPNNVDGEKGHQHCHVHLQVEHDATSLLLRNLSGDISLRRGFRTGTQQPQVVVAKCG